MNKLIRLRLATMVTMTMLAACASNNSLVSRLDTSGLTVVTLNNVIVLARPTPNFAMAARDYVYLGPVEINRMGKLQHYIWLGMASTVDRALANETLPKAETLALVVDGMPMTFPLVAWQIALDNAPYQSTLPVYESFAASASLDQIIRIAEATAIKVHIGTDKGVTDAYRRWTGNWPQWSAFHLPEKPRFSPQAKVSN